MTAGVNEPWIRMVGQPGVLKGLRAKQVIIRRGEDAEREWNKTSRNANLRCKVTYKQISIRTFRINLRLWVLKLPSSMQCLPNLLSHFPPGELLSILTEKVRILEKLGRRRRLDVMLSCVSQVGLKDNEGEFKINKAYQQYHVSPG